MRLFEQNRVTWDADTAEAIIDFIAGADRVAVRMIWRGAGQGPGLNLEWTTICMMRKGKVVYQEFFWGHAEALETVGLSEQDAHADH